MLFLDDCLVTFITQPPQELPCNPYDNAYNRLHLECSIVVATVNTSLRASWHYRPQNNNITRDLQISHKHHGRYHTSSFVSVFSDTTTVTSRLTIERVNVSDIGHYWCKLVMIEDSVLFEPIIGLPCYSTHLKAPSEYSNMVQCSRKTYLSTPKPVCGHYPNANCQSETSQNNSSCGGISSSLSIYLLLAFTPLLCYIIIALLMVVIICCRKHYKKCLKQPPTTIIFKDTCQQCGRNTCIPQIIKKRFDVPMLTAPTFTRPNQPCPINLPVSRQSSSHSDYQEIVTPKVPKTIVAVTSPLATEISLQVEPYIEPLQRSTSQNMQEVPDSSNLDRSIYQSLSVSTMEEQSYYSQRLSEVNLSK